MISFVCEHEHLHHMLRFVVIYGEYCRIVQWAISFNDDVFQTYKIVR